MSESLLICVFHLFFFCLGIIRLFFVGARPLQTSSFPDGFYLIAPNVETKYGVPSLVVSFSVATKG